MAISSRNSSLGLSVILLAGAITAAPVHASDTAAASDKATAGTEAQNKAVELDTVKTTANVIDGYAVRSSDAATKLSLSPRETPQSLTVITRERLDDENLTSLREVLDSATGVYSDQYDTERVLFYSRGFVIDTLMFDGVPAISNFNTSSIDETIDTALYDRIEIVRGATGLMTGAGSPAASINLVRKHADSEVPILSADLSAGSWNTRRVELDGSTPLNADGSIRARGVAVYEDRDSYQAVYNKKTAVLYGIVDWDVSPATRLSFGADHQANRPRGNTWGSFPLFLSDGTLEDWPRSVTTAADWSFWNRITDTAFGELRHTFDNGWMLHATANWRRYHESDQLFYVYGFPDPQTGEGLDPYAYKTRGRIIDRAIDLYASGPFEAFGRTHELVVGASGSRTSNTGVEYEPGDMADVGDFFQWDGSYPEPEFSAAVPLNNIDTKQTGLYAATRWSLADPLKLIAGARYATWDVDSFYLYDTPTDSTYDFRKTLPYAGLIYDIGPHYSLFTGFTGIFNPQNARDINGHYLDPVDGRSFEVGVKGEHFDGLLTSSLTLFDTLQNNVAAPVYDENGEPVLLPDGAQVSQAIDGTRSRGFEFEVSGRLGRDWNATFGWTRTVMHDGDGNPVRTYIPGTLVRAFVTWTPHDWLPGLALGGGVSYQDRSSTFVGSPDGGTTLHQGALAQVDLMARYEFSPHVSLQLNVDNALDKKYYVLDQYDNTYYGAPASANLTLRLKF
jgi:outer membrane receptor for ferric coprogen and ferric-rhodotorulic acid